VLLGIIGANGRVGYVRPQVRIDADFVVEASKGRSPERRFRFAGPCVEGACSQWTGSRCGIIDRVSEAQAGVDPDAVGFEGHLPRCSIRASCGWFAQLGGRACAVCPLVITDQRQAARSESGPQADLVDVLVGPLEPEGPSPAAASARGGRK
jgi:hypothetical protein